MNTRKLKTGILLSAEAFTFAYRVARVRYGPPRRCPGCPASMGGFYRHGKHSPLCGRR